MKTFICEICGDAYLGEEKPKGCPFCGARVAFIKNGSEASPIVNQVIKVSDVSRKNLMETLDLETKANKIYLCMAGKTEKYELKAMFKRIAKVELEHASIVCKILKIEIPQIEDEPCSEDDIENFQKTLELEKHATGLYFKFAKESVEKELKIMFTALAQAEEDHIELIKNYL
ncbi:ferritin family protein [Patescibacteria group bacterium]